MEIKMEMQDVLAMDWAGGRVIDDVWDPACEEPAAEDLPVADFWAPAAAHRREQSEKLKCLKHRLILSRILWIQSTGAWPNWKKTMIKILLAGRDKASLAALGAGLAEDDVDIANADSGRNGVSMIAENDFDLVIADENLGDMTGIDFIRKVVLQKPMVNSAIISSLPPEDFHEASEGLGILMQLPVRPKREDAARLLEQLKQILNAMKI
jgi:CheY-like chemotaxis protein